MGISSSYSNYASLLLFVKIYILIHFHRSQTNENQLIPTFAPAICKLRPDNAITSPVTTRDIAHWRSNPEELVGKCFTTIENIMRRTFLVKDYYIKRSGPCYNVVFEDTGPNDLNILDPESVLTMVKDAELVYVGA